MLSWRKFPGVLILLALAASTAGCDDTWRGLKQDTGENLEKTGEAIDRVGESVQGKEEQP